MRNIININNYMNNINNSNKHNKLYNYCMFLFMKWKGFLMSYIAQKGHSYYVYMYIHSTIKFLKKKKINLLRNGSLNLAMSGKHNIGMLLI